MSEPLRDAVESALADSGLFNDTADKFRGGFVQSIPDERGRHRLISTAEFTDAVFSALRSALAADPNLIAELGWEPGCRDCGGLGYVLDHDPGCWGNCSKHGCPVQAPCSRCEGRPVFAPSRGGLNRE